MNIFYLFNGNEYAEYGKSSEVDISSLIHQEGTYIYSDLSKGWGRFHQPQGCDLNWFWVSIEDVPKEYRAKLLLLT